MKSTKLSNKTSPGMGSVSYLSTIIRENTKRFWALPVIAAIIMILAGPVMHILRDSMYYGEENPAQEYASNSHPGFIFVFFVISIAAGLCVFGYLEKKGISNFIHGLPIKRHQLFAANYISGALLFTAPIVLTGILLILVFGWSSILAILWWMVQSVFICLIMYSITVFAGVISGNTFMHLFNALFFNFFAIIVLAIVSAYFEMLIPGYQTSSLVNNLIANSFPAAAFVGEASLATWIVYILITIALVVVSFILYNMRQIERTGESLIFDWTKYLIIGMVSFIGTLIFGTIFDGVFLLISGSGQGITPSLVLGLATGFVCNYIVMSLIVFRSPKIFKKKNLISAAIVAGVLIMFIGGIKVDVLGIGSKSIIVDDTAKAAVISSEIDDSTLRYDVSEFDVDASNIITISGENIFAFTDKDNIDSVRNIQKISRRYGEDNSSYTSYTGTETTISLRWQTDSREFFSQGYRVDQDTLHRMRTYFVSLYESKEFKDAYKLSNLKNDIKGVDIVDESNNEYLSINKNQYDSLIVAMDKDFENRTYDQIVQGEKMEDCTYCITLDVGKSMDVYVLSTDKNTMDWISKNAK